MVAAQLPAAAHAVVPGAAPSVAIGGGSVLHLGWLLDTLVVPHLTVLEASRLATTCREMRARVKAALGQLRALSLAQLVGGGAHATEAGALCFVAAHCPSLELLCLDAHCTDEHLAALVSGTGLRCLREFFLIGSHAVTDKGLSLLLAHCGRRPASRLPSLRLIDATCCPGVTHTSVGAAKQAGVQLVRLPAWFAQRWVCVSHLFIPTQEEHHYHRDGTFKFSREHQAEGHVLSFLPGPPGAKHMEVTVQFDDEEHAAMVGMPQYRPCVCVLQQPPDEQEGALHRGRPRMRTAQCTRVLACPPSVPEVDPPENSDVVCGTWVAAP